MSNNNSLANLFFGVGTLFALICSAYVSLLLWKEAKQLEYPSFSERWDTCLSNPNECAKDIKKHSDNFTLLVKAIEKEFMGSDLITSEAVKGAAKAAVKGMLSPKPKKPKANPMRPPLPMTDQQIMMMDKEIERLEREQMPPTPPRGAIGGNRAVNPARRGTPPPAIRGQNRPQGAQARPGAPPVGAKVRPPQPQARPGAPQARPGAPQARPGAPQARPGVPQQKAKSTKKAPVKPANSAKKAGGATPPAKKAPAK